MTTNYRDMVLNFLFRLATDDNEVRQLRLVDPVQDLRNILYTRMGLPLPYVWSELEELFLGMLAAAVVEKGLTVPRTQLPSPYLARLRIDADELNEANAPIASLPPTSTFVPLSTTTQRIRTTPRRRPAIVSVSPARSDALSPRLGNFRMPELNDLLMDLADPFDSQFVTPQSALRPIPLNNLLIDSPMLDVTAPLFDEKEGPYYWSDEWDSGLSDNDENLPPTRHPFSIV